MRLSQDMNKLFWQNLGVNHRVFEVGDIFNIVRDKQSDEQAYNRYINSPSKLKNIKFLEISGLNHKCLEDLFVKYIFRDGFEEVHFYLDQIMNTVMNCQVFDSLNLDRKNYINVFAFHCACIIYDMKIRNVSIKDFRETIKQKNLSPLISKVQKLLNLKTDQDLATTLSYKHDDISRILNQRGLYEIEMVTSESYKTRISEWKNNKSLPSLYNIIVLCTVISSATVSKDEIRALFIQILLARALLSCKLQYNLTKNEIEFFMQQIDLCLDRLQNNDKDFQSRFRINLIDIFALDISLEKQLEYMKDQYEIYFESNSYNFDDIFTQRLPGTDILTKDFEDKQYQKIIDELQSEEDTNNVQLEKQKLLLLLVSAIKCGESQLIRKSLKDFDRVCLGCYLSVDEIKIQPKSLIEALKHFNTFQECGQALGEFLQEQKKLSTFP